MGINRFRIFSASCLFVLVVSTSTIRDASAFSSIEPTKKVVITSQFRNPIRHPGGDNLCTRVSLYGCVENDGFHGVEQKHQEASFNSKKMVEDMQPRRSDSNGGRPHQRLQFSYIPRRQMLSSVLVGFSLSACFGVASVKAEEMSAAAVDPLEAFGRSLQEGQTAGQSGTKPPTWGSITPGVKGAPPTEKGDKWPATASPVPTFESTGAYASPPNINDAIRESKRVRAVGPLTHG